MHRLLTNSAVTSASPVQFDLHQQAMASLSCATPAVGLWNSEPAPLIATRRLNAIMPSTSWSLLLLHPQQAHERVTYTEDDGIMALWHYVT